MKRILVIGKNSYVGKAFASWLGHWPADYGTDMISLRELVEHERSFAGYDVVFHVDGIVHQPAASSLAYETINRDLAIKVAQASKSDGVGMFIMMSSAAVYDVKNPLWRKSEITAKTRLRPATEYGRSKLEAEIGVSELQDSRFKVCLIRSPMIYGPNCKGNYVNLRKLTLRFGLVPELTNERSMIYIQNLCEYVRLLIDRGIDGTVSPRDREAFCTAQVMEWIAHDNARSVKKSRLLGVGARFVSFFIPPLRKAFGNQTIDPSLSKMPLDDYCMYGLRDAIRETEAGFSMI